MGMGFAGEYRDGVVMYPTTSTAGYQDNKRIDVFLQPGSRGQAGRPNPPPVVKPVGYWSQPSDSMGNGFFDRID
jgi:hypothetical protein